MECYIGDMTFYMRKIIYFETIKNENNFWIFFFLTHFPQSWNENTDQTLSDIMEDSYEIDMDWVDNFTGYYEGVMDKSDGCIETPTTLQIELSHKKMLFIEYHPGDIIYYIDSVEIGCLGPHYKIQRISWQDFTLFTAKMDVQKAFLLLPMLAVKKEEQAAAEQFIINGLDAIKIIDWHDYKKIRKGIIAHCFVK